MIQTQILFRGETSALEKNQVESFPVIADKNLLSIENTVPFYHPLGLHQ